MTSLNSFALPERLALDDDDREYTEYLSQYLQGKGIGFHRFMRDAIIGARPPTGWL